MASIHAKQHALLHAYANFIGESSQQEADFAQCAAMYLSMGGNPNEQFVARLMTRASEYMTTQLSSMLGGPVQSDTPTTLTPMSSTYSSPLRATDSDGSLGSRRTMGSRKSTASTQMPANFDDSHTSENESATQTYNMTDDNTILNVYCEGTSVNIGTSNAKSGCGVYAKYIKEDFSVREFRKSFCLSTDEPASNQRAELRSFYSALDTVQRIKDANPHLKTFNVHIASKYALNCATDWGRAWSANKWKRAEGPIKNVDIVRALYEKLESMPFVSVVLFQKEKKAGGGSKGSGAGTDADMPEGFNVARELAIVVIHK